MLYFESIRRVFGFPNHGGCLYGFFYDEVDGACRIVDAGFLSLHIILAAFVFGFVPEDKIYAIVSKVLLSIVKYKTVRIDEENFSAH